MISVKIVEKFTKLLRAPSFLEDLHCFDEGLGGSVFFCGGKVDEGFHAFGWRSFIRKIQLADFSPADAPGLAFNLYNLPQVHVLSMDRHEFFYKLKNH